jgi:hypothetical protein
MTLVTLALLVAVPPLAVAQPNRPPIGADLLP